VNDCPCRGEPVESVKPNFVGITSELVTVDVTIAVVVTVEAAKGLEYGGVLLGNA
jgi:hypothetical protein